MSHDAETAHRPPLSSPLSPSSPSPVSSRPDSLPWVERLVSIDTTSRLPNGLIEMVRDAAIEFTPIASAPGLDAVEEAAITALVRSLTGDRATRKVAYGTEAGLFARAGVPSIVCGPGDIQQAHRANEYVELSQLAACEAFLCKVIHSMSVGAHP